MNVPVTTAFKHGATAEIGEAIAKMLNAQGYATFIMAPEEVEHVDDVEAVILGSAVCAGHWLKPAKEFIERCQAGLVGIPVRTFSSGPIGDPPKPDEDPVDAADVLTAVNTTEHRLFAGKLDTDTLGFAERAVIKALRAPAGDFRDWDEISGWANEIAAARRNLTTRDFLPWSPLKIHAILENSRREGSCERSQGDDLHQADARGRPPVHDRHRQRPAMAVESHRVRSLG